jgi:hypothetical protein
MSDEPPIGFKAAERICCVSCGRDYPGVLFAAYERFGPPKGMIDGQAVTLQPIGCCWQCVAFMASIRAEMLKQRAEQSGGSISAGVCPECQQSPCIGHPRKREPPDSNKTGG